MNQRVATGPGPGALTARALKDTARLWLRGGVSAMLIEVLDIQGSTPREAGTRMLVSPHAVEGTIGGGHLEWQAMKLAREALRAMPETPPSFWTQRFALGPSLGQCCGGSVLLSFAPLNEATLAAWRLPPARFHLELHGAGHVGQAIARLLADVDCTVRWIDERPSDVSDIPEGATVGATESAMAGHAGMPHGVGLPSAQTLSSLPEHIRFLPTDAAPDEVADAPPGACHLVLTHRHDLDLRIVEAILRRGDAGFVGMIGSKTKRAKFEHRLSALGLSDDTLQRLVCPIGLPGIAGKEPAVIAISVVAQLLHGLQPLPDHAM